MEIAMYVCPAQIILHLKDVDGLGEISENVHF